MNKSINEKLFALQNEIGAISKDAKNPFYKSKYFDINSLIKQLQPLLEKHRLLLLQPPKADGDVLVYTYIFCVDSGEFVEASMKLPDLADIQKLGGAVTYLRRYTLSSLLGLQSEDDDGNAASNASVKPSVSKAKDKLSKDRFDNAVKQYKNNPEYIKDNLRKYTLDEVQLNILNKNKIVL
tara:strand:- start:6248 stop:6790 length:543 start_codon:yes stop_codon:yes gene_type:complete